MPPHLVPDASVVVSACFGGPSRKALIKAEHCELLLSPPIISELRQLLLELRHELHPDNYRRLRRLVRRLTGKSKLLDVPGRLHICRDPTDDVYLETCQVGRAHYLITRDKDLLEVDPADLKRHRLGRLQILKPEDFLKVEL